MSAFVFIYSLKDKPHPRYKKKEPFVDRISLLMLWQGTSMNEKSFYDDECIKSKTVVEKLRTA